MKNKIKILIINGPNMNMLGRRDSEIYGSQTYVELCDFISDFCSNSFAKDKVQVIPHFFQSNHEGEIVDKIQESGFGQFDSIVLNAAAYTHYSIAIRDAIELINVPVAEVHMSDVDNREEFRRISVIRDVCEFSVCGQGLNSYTTAIQKIVNKIIKQEN